MEGRRKAFISAWELPVPAGQKCLPQGSPRPILFSAAALLSHVTHPPANGDAGTLGGRHVSGDAGKLPGDPDLPSANHRFKQRLLPAPHPTLGASPLVSDLDGQRPFIPQQWVFSPPLPLGPFGSLCPQAPPFLQRSPGLQTSSGLALNLSHMTSYQGSFIFCLA